MWPGIQQLLKITSFQCLRNNMLDYLDFWYVRRPPSHGNTLLHISITDYLFQIFWENSSCFLFEQKHPKWPTIEVFGILFFKLLFFGKWSELENMRFSGKTFTDLSSPQDQSDGRTLLKEFLEKEHTGLFLTFCFELDILGRHKMMQWYIHFGMPHPLRQIARIFKMHYSY